MPVNFYMWFVAGLIPIFIGYIYYHPKVFGAAWMKANNFSEESLKEGNMVVILGVSYILSVVLAMILSGMVIHQTQALAMMAPEVLESGSAVQNDFNVLMSQFGDKFRTFKHGMLHGGTAAVMFALPILAINALFERRGWKYSAVHFGYWFITLMLMGGVLCASLKFAPLT